MTLIHVGARPDPFLAKGLFFDGDGAVGQSVQVSVDENAAALVMQHETDGARRWPLGDIRVLPDQAGRDQIVLRLRDDATARLVMTDARILSRLPNAHRRAPTTRRGRLLAWAVAAIASVALIITVLVPTMADQLADYIPPEGERALGETTLNQIRRALDESGMGTPVPLCSDPEGVAALDKMRARLADARPEETPVTVHVLDHGMLNAFALPGGYVVFFNGLIAAAETPEEVAAVFAHEIGHVVSRDPTRHALRSAGSIGVLGLLLGDFAGGAAVLFLTEQLIQARYSRQAEAEADRFGRSLLLDADIDPAAMGVFFRRLKEKYGDREGLLEHFASHPALSDRILASDIALPDGFEPRLVLSDAEWAALRRICD